MHCSGKTYLQRFISVVSECHSYSLFPDSVEFGDCSLVSTTCSWCTRPQLCDSWRGPGAAVALALGPTLCLDLAVLHWRGAWERSKRLKESFNFIFFCPLQICIGPYTGDLYFSTRNRGRAKGFCLLETIRFHHRTGRPALLTAGHLEAALQCVFRAEVGPLYCWGYVGFHLRTCRVYCLLLCSPCSGYGLRADQRDQPFEPAMGPYI